VDATAHYRHLIALGREGFLASSAPAALVRYRGSEGDLDDGGATPMLDQDDDTHEETLPHRKDVPEGGGTLVEVYPLTKKPGASFPDRITIGRTANNDIVIVDNSVSRFHAYVRLDDKQWIVADAGSKNGSWLSASSLAARKERKLSSKSILRIGDVDLTFYLAPDLYAALGGS
jgi:hypothetical protein